jgi:hypothetical protein
LSPLERTDSNLSKCTNNPKTLLNLSSNHFIQTFPLKIGAFTTPKETNIMASDKIIKDK